MSLIKKAQDLNRMRSSEAKDRFRLPSQPELEEVISCVLNAANAKVQIIEQPESMHGPRYEMCKDQAAQIDCRRISCKFHIDGACRNISPAITLNDSSFTCWSEEPKTITP